MDNLDRIETNFRLSQISQREQSAKLRELSERVGTLTTITAGLVQGLQQVSSGLAEVSSGLAEVARKSDETADRLEDSIQVMRSFAQGQDEIRQILREHSRRLDALEDKAS